MRPWRAGAWREVRRTRGSRNREILIPLLVLDAWEHAFYLQYQNRKTEFFEAMWHVWNWQDVAERYRAARQVDVNLRDAAR